MSEIKFVKFNEIKEYARVMYNDVKDADKYKIEVVYNGRDVKELLEYLFELEIKVQKLQEANNYLSEDLIKAMNIINNEILKEDNNNEKNDI